MPINFGAIQTKLNQDSDFRNKFLRDPIATLRDEGLELSPEMETNLKKFVRELNEGPKPVAGSNVTQGQAAMTPMISISIDF